MNWYKKANLLEEITKIGPNTPIEDLDDPRVQFISEKYNISKEDAFNKMQDTLMSEFYKRQYFTSKYGWSVPNEKAVEEIKDFVSGDSIIEIGSGYGMWAKIMQDAGISITPTDSFGNRGNYVPHKDKDFTDIEDLEVTKALEKYGNYNVLMMSWPPCDDPLANNALKSFGGSKLIFIGEGDGGCTGDKNFFNELDANWNEVKYVQIPRWNGIYDALYLYNRK